METEEAAAILREMDNPSPEKEKDPETSEPSPKRQKTDVPIEEKEKEQEEYSADEKHKRKRLLQQLSILINTHPDLNLTQTEEDEFLAGLPTAQLQQILDSALLKTGASDVFTIPKIILVFIAKALKFQFGMQDLSPVFSGDMRLQNMIQEFVPIHHWTVAPLEIAHRIWHHIEQSFTLQITAP